jgi:hypothetical protein
MQRGLINAATKEIHMNEIDSNTISLDMLANVSGGGPMFTGNGMTPNQFSAYNRGQIITKDLRGSLKAPVGNLEMTPGGIIFGFRPFAR